mmetsp:Transcript_106194/g.310427  ORF Transcript_106194/g.310427 Transcript_106194/m.310427 type:complete len:341 (+) Transcript_106194:284-1306(+)
MCHGASAAGGASGAAVDTTRAGKLCWRPGRGGCGRGAGGRGAGAAAVEAAAGEVLFRRHRLGAGAAGLVDRQDARRGLRRARGPRPRRPRLQTCGPARRGRARERGPRPSHGRCSGRVAGLLVGRRARGLGGLGVRAEAPDLLRQPLPLEVVLLLLAADVPDLLQQLDPLALKLKRPCLKCVCQQACMAKLLAQAHLFAGPRVWGDLLTVTIAGVQASNARAQPRLYLQAAHDGILRGVAEQLHHGGVGHGARQRVLGQPRGLGRQLGAVLACGRAALLAAGRCFSGIIHKGVVPEGGAEELLCADRQNAPQRLVRQLVHEAREDLAHSARPPRIWWLLI